MPKGQEVFEFKGERITRSDGVNVNYEITDYAILEADARTNCPQGGDGGHGGFTQILLRDHGGSFRFYLDGDVIGVDAWGDAEARVLISCLRFLADSLEDQYRGAEGRPSRPYRIDLWEKKEG